MKQIFKNKKMWVGIGVAAAVAAVYVFVVKGYRIDLKNKPHFYIPEKEKE